MKRSIIFIITSLFLFVSCANAEKKEMKSSDILKLIKKGKAVQIVDKIILDDLDFTQANEPVLSSINTAQVDISPNVFFSHCVFMGNVSTYKKQKQVNFQTVFKNNLIFMNCDFRGEVNFRGTTVFGNVNFSNSTFRKSAEFNNMTIWSRNIYFNEIISEQSFTMIGAAFFGNTSFMDSKFEGKTNFQEISVNGRLTFNNASFGDKTDFSLIEISGRALFHYAVFEKNVTFLQSRFLQSAEFANATFNGSNDFEKAFFYDTVDTNNVKPAVPDFSKAVFLRK